MKAEKNAREAPLCHVLEEGNVNVVSALVSRLETAGCTENIASVMIGSVKT